MPTDILQTAHTTDLLHPLPVDNSQQARVTEKRVRRFSRRRIFNLDTIGWLVIDGTIAVMSVAAGFTLSPVATGVTTSEKVVGLIPFAISFALLLLPAAHIAGLHNPRNRSNFAELSVRCLFVSLLAVSILTLGWMLFSFLRVGRYILVIATTISAVGMIMTRWFSWRWLTTFKPAVCFLGSDKFCSDVAQFLDDNPIPLEMTGTPELDKGLRRWATDNDVTEIVYDSRTIVDDLALLSCLDAGIKVSSYTDFVEEKYQLVPVENITANWLFSARLDLAHPYYQGVKRLTDIVVSVAGLVLSAPLLGLAAIVIKLESKGPVFYSQIRTGRFNRPFRIYKLRTMINNSERNGAQWASKNDARITFIGKILRKTRLDEIPQFLNVLRGEMSLIGPRPERPEFVESLSQDIPFYSQRHLIKPGLTGWAQINYPYGASVLDAKNKLTYDLYYIKHASLAMDTQIVLRTIGTVMKGSR